MDTADSVTQVTEATFDMKSAVDQISEDLFPSSEVEEVEEIEETASIEEPVEEPIKETKEPEESKVEAKPAPQSWKKEMQEVFGKLDPKVQEYIHQREEQMKQGLEKDRQDSNIGRAFRDVLAPFSQAIRQSGLDEPTAVRRLLDGHMKLVTAPQEEKARLFQQMARDYGVNLTPNAQNGEEIKQESVDPRIIAMQNELNSVKSYLTQAQQRTLNEARAKIQSDVEAFASAHDDFDELADEISKLITAGYELPDAYEKAQWANPVTREKRLASELKQREEEAKERAKQEAEAAKKAKSVNVVGRNTKKAPTELLGTMEDTMREVLRKRKSQH